MVKYNEQNIIDDIKEQLEQLKKFDNASLDELKSDEGFQEEFKRYESLIMKAVRADLANHKLVYPYYRWLCRIGEKKFLRDRGQRVGAQNNAKTITPLDQFILESRIRDLAAEGKTRKKVQEVLTKEKLIRIMTKQGFDKKLDKLNLKDIFDK